MLSLFANNKKMVIGVVALFLLIIIVWQLFNSATDDLITLDQEESTEDVGEVIGIVSLTEHGGNFVKDGIEIDFAPGLVRNSTELTIVKLTKDNKSSQDYSYASDVYALIGLPDELYGEVNVKITIPQAAIDQYNQDADAVVEDFTMLVHRDVFAPTSGATRREDLLPTEVDFANRIVKGTWKGNDIAQAMNYNNRPLLFASRVKSTRDLLDYNKFETAIATPSTSVKASFQVVRFFSGERKITSESNNFRVTFNKNRVFEENILELISELEQQKLQIEALGFTFAGRTKYPIDIKVKKMSNIGGYIGALESAQAGYIELKEEPYFTINLQANKNSGQWQEMVLTAGHELLHLSQSFYDKRYSFIKNSPYVYHENHWLDEAVATWYEPKAIASIDYISANALANIGFIRTPLYYPASNNLSGRHGYGASWFIRYLTNKYGEQLPAEIYNDFASRTSSEQYSGVALNSALTTNYNTETSEEWLDFIARLTIAPAEIYPGINSYGLWNKLELHANGEEEVVVSYDDAGYFSEHKIKIEEGNITLGEQAVVNINMSLGNLSAEPFILEIAKDEVTQSIFKQQIEQGNIKISVQNNGDTGVFVYAANDYFSNAGTSLLPVAREPWSFMASSAGGQHLGSSQANIDFGLTASSWPQLLVIPFNYNDNPKELTHNELNIEIVFSLEAEEFSLQMFNPYDSSRGSMAKTNFASENGYPIVANVNFGAVYGLRAELPLVEQETKKVRMQWNFNSSGFESAHGYDTLARDFDNFTGINFIETYGRFFQAGKNIVEVSVSDITNGNAPKLLHQAGLEFYLANISSVTSVQSGKNVDQWQRSAAKLGEGVAFQALQADGDYMYRWDFGDGNSIKGTDIVVSHKYAKPGRYRIALELQDKNGNTLATAPYRYLLVTEEEIEQGMSPASSVDDDIIGAWELNVISIDWIHEDLVPHERQEWLNEAEKLARGESIMDSYIIIIKKDEQGKYRIAFPPATAGAYGFSDSSDDYHIHLGNLIYSVSGKDLYYKYRNTLNNSMEFNGKISNDNSFINGTMATVKDDIGEWINMTVRGQRYFGEQLYECSECGIVIKDGWLNSFGPDYNMHEPCPGAIVNIEAETAERCNAVDQWRLFP